METVNMKNMVVLRNLQSNLVEEAIVILKANNKIKKKEIIEKSKKINAENKSNKNKEYIIKEAEMLISNYISSIENNKIKERPSRILMNKYSRLKKYSLAVTIILFISLIINFI